MQQRDVRWSQQLSASELATLIRLALHLCREVIASSQLRGDPQHVSDTLTSFVLHRKLSYFLNSSLFDSPELLTNYQRNCL